MPIICDIKNWQFVNFRKFIKLELLPISDAHLPAVEFSHTDAVYLWLEDNAPVIIRDLTTQSLLFGYTAFTGDRPPKRKEKYLIATDKTYKWISVDQIPQQVYIIHKYELIDIEDIVNILNEVNNDEDKSILMNFLGCCYTNGCLTKSRYESKNIEHALKWFEKSMKLGNLDSQMRLGQFLFQRNIFNDTKKAILIFSTLAKKGNTEARYMQARCLLRFKKYEGARTCLLDAAEKEHAQAEFLIGKYIEKSLFTFEDPNSNDSYSWYSRAAEHGYPFAIAMIAESELDNYYRKRDSEYLETSESLFRKAIAMGETKISLKHFYHQGEFDDPFSSFSVKHPGYYHDEYWCDDEYDYSGDEPEYMPQYDNYCDDDFDYELEAYLFLGGDREKYYDGCLDDYMDSIGL